MTASRTDPVSDANEIRQLATPYLPRLSPIRATIAVQAMDTIDAVCRDVAQCQAGTMTSDVSDYITAWHAVQQAASSLRYAIGHELADGDSNLLAAAVNRTTLSLRPLPSA